jgi:hypothetical protein
LLLERPFTEVTAVTLDLIQPESTPINFTFRRHRR